MSKKWNSPLVLTLAVLVVASGFFIYQRVFAISCDGVSSDSSSFIYSGGYCRGFITSGSSWTVPSDWNSSDNTIEVIGGGGGSDSTNCSSSCVSSGGSGGGGYSEVTNVTLSGTVGYNVGAAGTGGDSTDGSPRGSNGGNTWFCNSTSNCTTATSSASIVGAISGSLGTLVSNGGGGAGGCGASIPVASTTRCGGNGGNAGDTASGGKCGGGGGGGGAGPDGDGENGGNGNCGSATDNCCGGGGGGGGGGTSSTVGSAASSGIGGNGGNGPAGTGGGAGGNEVDGVNATAGTGGGGGGGGVTGATGSKTEGGDGATGSDWSLFSKGAGGGGGGSVRNNVQVGIAGLYGGGGGGAGANASGNGNGGDGAQGLIMIKYAKAAPAFTQDNWRWFANADDEQPGSALADENATTTGVVDGGTLRLRMNLSVATTELATSSQVFILQYSEATTTNCTTVTGWADITYATTTDGVNQYWTQYDNPSVTDGATTTALLLSNSTKLQSYEEATTSAANPQGIPVGEIGEWDWVIRNNGAKESTTYCFRMVLDNHAALDTYNSDGYPKLTTAAAPVTEIHYRWRNDDGGEGNVTQFGTMGSTTSNPHATLDDDIMHGLVDGSHIYAVGMDTIASGNTQWRIEKRNTSDGSLVGAFGSSGVVNSNPTSGEDEATRVAVDDTYLYVAGVQNTSSCNMINGSPELSTGDCAWRIEKYNKTTGNICDSVADCAAGAFDTDGATTTDPTTGNDLALSAYIDSNYLYVGGSQSSSGSRDMRLMKFNKSTGALCDGASNCADGAFSTDGISTSSPSSADDLIFSLAGDDLYLYAAGKDESVSGGEFYIEKRLKSTGALVTEFGALGIIQQDVDTSDPDMIFYVKVDPGYLYVAGESCEYGGSGSGTCSGAANYGIVLQKRNINTGSLCSSVSVCGEGAFSSDGSFNANIRGNHDAISSIALDEDYIYGSGITETNSNTQAWYMAKFNRITGNICDSSATCDSGEFGSFGSTTEDLTNATNGFSHYIYGSGIDSQHVYYMGFDDTLSNRKWKVEKRYKDNNALVQTITGGATWSESEDTASSTVTKGNNVRLRFSVKNTGNAALQYKDRLQVATKGAAASCEAVASGDFLNVPEAGNCGTAKACMVDSSNMTDGARTTPQLTAPTPNFVFGNTVDNASYKSATSTLYKNQYTEHEYGIQFTSNATDGTAYCFRLTNQGTALNTYTVIAAATTSGTAVTAPTVETNAASSINATGATLNGNITATGGETGAGTAHGFVVSTNATLSADVSTTSLGTYSGTGAFNTATTTLTTGTLYYFRAYASNSAGVGYGSILSFTPAASSGSANVMQILKSATMNIMKGGLLKILPHL